MKKFISFLMMIGVAFFTSSMAMAQTTNPESSIPKKQSLLFVLVAENGEIQQDVAHHHYHLILTGVNPNLIYITDRPARQSGSFDMEYFIKQWTQGPFKQNPPNAVMQALRINKSVDHSINYAIVLTHPQYDEKKQTIEFDIKPLKGNKVALPKTANSKFVALFIDGWCLDCTM